MFVNEYLNKHLNSSSTIKSQSAVIAEWNMNFSDNIQEIGNYRYRPLLGITQKYGSIPNFYDPRDVGNFYTGATDADIVVDGGVEEDGETPILFRGVKQKEKLLYSLEDCFGKFRPRSGVNKLRYNINSKYLHHSNPDMFDRPRYYMGHKTDKFKYWSSYRTENGQEYGVANKVSFGESYIEDVAPYVVYKEPVPVNRIVVKLQTHTGEIDLGPFSNSLGIVPDPFYGSSNKATPVKWKIQYLKEGMWSDAVSFDKLTKRSDGSEVFDSSGYLEIAYGLKVPEEYKVGFINNGEIASTTILPEENSIGQAYLVKASSSEIGLYYIWTGSAYETFAPDYGWYLGDQQVLETTSFVTETTSPQKYQLGSQGSLEYTEVIFISGIRLVVETMNKLGSTLDLIELSPRLSVDLTSKVVSYKLQKGVSDLGLSGLPVGQLLASTGDIQFFDYDQSFNPLNEWNPDDGTGSIIGKYIGRNTQIKFYEVIHEVDIVDQLGREIQTSFYVPVKTMYSESFPTTNSQSREVSMNLRDLFFYFESMTAPELLIPNASLSYILATLLDSIGFTNYVFKRIPGESDPIIPYFFVSPDKSVAEILQDLAKSTQTAMFFDEYNNFVTMSKSFMLPAINDRQTDSILFGSKDQKSEGIVENKTDSNIPAIANIVAITSQDNNVYNDGKINYTTRHIQKSTDSIRQPYVANQYNSWIYRSTALWEVAGSETTKSVNGALSGSERSSLAAVPLNSTLSSLIPEVVNHEIVNNIIDLGEGVAFLSGYNGYLYANGEIIRYDAVEYNVSVLPSSVQNSGFLGGNVWVSNVEDYDNYFSKLSFNGKIYPTGRVRIYAEPNYESFSGITRMANGPVAKHGRCQFGTGLLDTESGKNFPINHEAGLDPRWSSNDNVYGCRMKSKFLFGGLDYTGTTSAGLAGVEKALATKSSRSSLIKNYMAFSYNEEISRKNKLSTSSETVQASALAINGPSFSAQESSIDFISYVNKPLQNSYKHFGTRMRIVGKIENNETSVQTAAGATSYYTVPTSNPQENMTVSGGSGGLSILLNPDTNNGYYFEIVALSESNLDKYASSGEVSNVVFYKIVKNTDFDVESNAQVPAAATNTTLAGQTDGALLINNLPVAIGQRIWLNKQTSQEQNGYYQVVNPGSATSKWELRRDEEAIPVKLWSGVTQIVVDDGNFTGQSRITAEEVATVYDLAIEYQDFGGFRRFFLYLNDTQIATVDDKTPLPAVNANNMALFVRGGSHCMFENVYALSSNYTQNTSFELDAVANSVFTNKKDITANDSFRKYSISGIVQPTYLSGISPAEPPKYNMYYEEFGTIMREVVYFNVKYDKAYPALYATISPTFNKMRGYTVSGFFAGAYGAEFLIFNATDTTLYFDEQTGNHLRIQGITFTQDSSNDLTVDDYFSRVADFSDPTIKDDGTVLSPIIQKKMFDDIKNSRTTHGRNEFNLDAPYIQSRDEAERLMSWIVSKIMKPRKSVGVKVFANPTIQLGDVVTINYEEDGVDLLVEKDRRFVVYNIEYSKNLSGPEMTAYLSEVV
jgi:hypothetical protein